MRGHHPIRSQDNHAMNNTPTLETTLAPEIQIEELPVIKRVSIIVNPACNPSRPALGILNAAFAASGIQWKVAVITEPDSARRAAVEAVQEGADVVMVYGGDGTVMEVASGLVGQGSAIPLAILPGGTANVMSVELGIPADLAAACALVTERQGGVRAIDVGQAGDYVFLTRISLGMEAQIIGNTGREEKNQYGWLAYALSTLVELSNPPIARYRLNFDGQVIEDEGVACLVANSAVFSPNVALLGANGLTLVPYASIMDGLLDVILIRGTDIAALLEVLANMMAGSEDTDLIQHWHARQVSIEATPPQPIQCDGEIIGNSPVTARILPLALRVVVPKPLPPTNS